MERLCDITALEKLTGGDQAFTQKMITIFLDHAPQDLDEMKQALDKKDYTAISSKAHKIKPSINYMCITRMYEDVIALEAWSDSDDLMVEKANQFITDLIIAVEQLKSL